MSGHEVPRYFSQSTVARRLGVTRAAVTNWRKRWPPDDPLLPTPWPDAFVERSPLWLQSSLLKWDAWREQHVQQWGNRMSSSDADGSGPRKKEVTVPQAVVVGVSEAEAQTNRAALQRLLHELHASAGWPQYGDLASRSGLSYHAVLSTFNEQHLPERQSIIDLVTALRGNPQEAVELWAVSRPSRNIDGGWLSRVLSVVHGKVLELAAVGTSLEGTAAAMGWTIDGVRSYWRDIIDRLRVQSMDEAVWLALESGYLVTKTDGSIVLAQIGGPPKQGGEHGYLLYQVAHELREQVAALPPGTVLPTIDAMRAERRTSATTMSGALKMLKAEGVITGGGKGHPFVVADREKD